MSSSIRMLLGVLHGGAHRVVKRLCPTCRQEVDHYEYVYVGKRADGSIARGATYTPMGTHFARCGGLCVSGENGQMGMMRPIREHTGSGCSDCLAMSGYDDADPLPDEETGVSSHG